MSWWAGEIHIWRIPGHDRSQQAASQKDNEFDEVRTRILAARILIQVGLFKLFFHDTVC